MGWDYLTYIQQPNWFIDLITQFIKKKYNDSSKITNLDRRR
jgi:hypothetical protein